MFGSEKSAITVGRITRRVITYLSRRVKYTCVIAGFTELNTEASMNVILELVFLLFFQDMMA